MIGRAAPSPLLVPPSSAVDWFRCVSGWASALAPEGKGKQGRLRSKVLAGLCFSPGNRRRRVPAERSRAASSSALPRGAGRFPSVSYFASGAGGDGVWRQGRGGEPSGKPLGAACCLARPGAGAGSRIPDAGLCASGFSRHGGLGTSSCTLRLHVVGSQSGAS